MKKWFDQIDKTTQEFQLHFGSLSMDELNWKPDSKSWSIGQNIDHLIIINESYFPILDSMHIGSYKPPFVSKIGFLVSIFGKMILKAVQPNRQKKTSTFPIWEPAESDISGKILEKFANHQIELKQKIEQSQQSIDNGAIINSPANKNIVYKLETAFDIIVTHELRHLEQAKEVLVKLKTI